MSMTPEQAFQQAALQEQQVWTPIINANNARAMANRAQNAVEQTAENYTRHYEAILSNERTRFKRELDLLEQMLDVKERRLNLEKEKADANSKAQQRDQECLVTAMIEMLGNQVTNDIFRRKDEILQKESDSDGNQGDTRFSMFD